VTASRGLAAIAAVFAFVLLGTPATASGATSCNLVAATTGSDANPGTVAQPLQSAGAMASRLAPGQTGCFRAGTYVSSSGVRLATPGIVIASFPGERATLQGRLRIEATARGAVVEDLILDGRNAGDELSPLIYASDVVLRGNEITNYNTAICVHLDHYPGAPVPTNVVIEGNRIHHCGELPATNFDHGIYVGKAVGTVIRGNWIYDNADRGIQLYSQAHGTLVTGNVIDGNGQGVIFGGEQENPSSGNIVERNVISNSTLRDNVEASWGGSPGTGNIVRTNCIGGGVRDEGDGGILAAADPGFVATDNVIAQPQFANRAANDLRVVPGSACDGILEGNKPIATEPQTPRILLKASRPRVAAGERLVLTGRSQGAAAVELRIRRGGSWRHPIKVPARGDSGRFRAAIRVRRAGPARFKATAPGRLASRRVQVTVAAGRSRR
jgi:parallel beta-helix repeat protein